MAGEVGSTQRLAASILMKNEIVTNWKPKAKGPHYNGEERSFIKDNIINTIPIVPAVIR